MCGRVGTAEVTFKVKIPSKSAAPVQTGESVAKNQTNLSGVVSYIIALR